METQPSFYLSINREGQGKVAKRKQGQYLNQVHTHQNKPEGVGGPVTLPTAYHMSRHFFAS